jgi:hypothetical protein
MPFALVLHHVQISANVNESSICTLLSDGSCCVCWYCNAVDQELTFERNMLPRNCTMHAGESAHRTKSQQVQQYVQSVPLWERILLLVSKGCNCRGIIAHKGVFQYTHLNYFYYILDLVPGRLECPVCRGCYVHAKSINKRQQYSTLHTLH